MKNAYRLIFAAVFAVLPLAAAVAQTQAPTQSGQNSASASTNSANSSNTAPTTEAKSPPVTSAGRPDKAIQRIRTEDAGTRIDELRVGGETQQITVQPKTGGAAYEVNPAEGAHGAAPAAANGDTNGSRVWNVLKF